MVKGRHARLAGCMAQPGANAVPNGAAARLRQPYGLPDVLPIKYALFSTGRQCGVGYANEYPHVQAPGGCSPAAKSLSWLPGALAWHGWPGAEA